MSERERDMPASRAILPAALALACGGQTPEPGTAEPGQRVASAFFVDDAGLRVGVATFKADADGGMAVTISTGGLTPGPHGIHVHENGDCKTPDFMSAGSHFNPSSRQHGLDNPDGPHDGDMPNLVVKENGTADTTLPLRTGLIRPDSQALVIHEGADDQRTDPTGNSGRRLYCGVIKRN
jgi:Cu-Zn family superoxide dismutase